MGSFFAGGRTVIVEGEPVRSLEMSGDVPAYAFDPNGTYAIDHAYVSYLIPAHAREVPVVFVHGGGMTGACWESTPDGRPGWLTSFLRDGWPCYVVDNVERGRAGWCCLPGLRSGEPIMRSEQECWTSFRIGPEEGYEERAAFPGSAFPVGALAALTRQMVPRWLTTGELGIAALRGVVDEVGPCVLIGHSQGGGFAARVASAVPGTVLATVLLEPHGLPAQAASPQLLVIGDNIERSVITAQLAPVWQRYRATSAQVDVLDLPSLGQHGNSHLMMADLNSELVSALVREWIGKTTAVTLDQGRQAPASGEAI
jgi:pimeloyl-ACP methyl ester carboxylesterase